MTVWANLVDGEIKGVYDLLPDFWNGNPHFRIDAQVDETGEVLRQGNFVKIVRCNPDFNKETHKLSDYLNYTIEDGQVIEHRDIIPIPEQTNEGKYVGIRSLRDFKMTEFEWRYTRYEREVRLGLTPTDNLQKMDEYMQQLADLPNDLNINLDNPNWPVYTP